MAESAGTQVAYTGGTMTELTADTHSIQREFYDFYRSLRGEFSPPSQPEMPTTQPTLASNTAFMNFYPFAAEPKELMIVPGAGHVDLYDRTALIPFGKLAEFFRGNLS